MGLSPKEIVRSRGTPKACGHPDYLGRVCTDSSADSTRTTAGSLIKGKPVVETMRDRIGFVAIKQNTSHVTPKKIAASTSVRKCAPNAIRLNPARTISDTALKMGRSPPMAPFDKGQNRKQELSVKKSCSDGCDRWQNCNQTNPQMDHQEKAVACEQESLSTRSEACRREQRRSTSPAMATIFSMQKTIPAQRQQ